MSDLGFSTKVIHTPFIKKDAHGALHYPIYESVAFEFESAEEIELAFRGEKPAHAYSRLSNPTVEYFEHKLTHITGALSVTATSSGMSAIANVLIALLQSGDNVITSRNLFSNTLSILQKTLSPFGIGVKFADLTNLSDIEKNIDDNTRLIFFETITNPQLELIDYAEIVALANRKNIVVISDSTTTPPYLFNSKKWGIHIEVISSTKFISGGATSVGGIIIDNGLVNWHTYPKLAQEAKKFGQHAFTKKIKKEMISNLGASLTPHNAFLQSLGLDTLALRADKACQNALALATWLAQQTAIKKVNYPGLPENPSYALSKKYFNGKCGGILTFNLSSKQACYAFMNKLQLIRRATNLNDNKTLIIHPASTIFWEYSTEFKEENGIPDTLMRLSVGIEEVTDLIQDIQQALE